MQLSPSFRFGAEAKSSFQVLWQNGEHLFCRGWHLNDDGHPTPVLAVLTANEHPTPASLRRLAHEYGLRDELDSAWALRPLELRREGGRTALMLEDPGGELLARMLDVPMGVGRFLGLAASIAAALAHVHRRGLIHRDVNPANILVEPATGRAWLTGFGFASRLPRERQVPAPPEEIAGTLAYMAPEQTGRMNRSVDARSDLYALGVTLYQMLTGAVPFTASDPLEMVHCHIARQPMPPTRRRPAIPQQISDIVLKLLAKTAEERYQTAVGLEADLRRCLAEWQAHGRIAPFPLGTRDLADRLLIPEKLYGREREIEALVAAFDRVVAGGPPELVLIAGYSGIGKSALVNELHRALVPPRGLFASGKFDQYQRDIPYSTLAQAFQGLVRPLLGKSEAELNHWRDQLRAALEPNGALMVQLVPELALILGPQPPIPELAPHDAQRRFQLAFGRFLGVFARAEHPLALFLDDLQWLDAATLDLLEYLATQPELRHLLLIGAYRDNEVTPTHPLMRRLAAIRNAGMPVQDIVLAPLGLADVGRLIAETLHCEPERAAPLAQLVHEKTAGNPFFIVQFLASLAEDGLLAVDYDEVRWSWDLERIRAKGYTDNVVELMVGVLSRLPEAAQHALKLLACLGNSAPISTVAMVRGSSDEALDAALREAVRAGLVLWQEGGCRFLHDRVQEAAYALIPQSDRAAEHLRIGRLLAADTPPEALTERVFEIVSQLNRGAALITTTEEREQVAELNLIAGQRAKQSTAYTSALNYLVAGAAMLTEDRWERRYDLTFPLELARAECEFLVGAHAVSEVRLAELARHAASVPDLAAVTRLRVELCTTVGRNEQAVEVCIKYLQLVGVGWSAHPTDEEVRGEYEQIWRRLGDRPIEALLDLPRMADPCASGTMDVLTAFLPAAMSTDPNLFHLALCRMANLSLDHGNSDGSCFGYVWLGVILGPHFGDYRVGFRFGKLGLDLVEQRGLRRFAARVYMVFGNRVIPWTQPIRTGRSLARRAFNTANELGDLTYASFSCFNLITNLLASGDPLADVQNEAEIGLEFVRQVRFGLVIDIMTAQLQLIRTLRGLAPVFGHFDGDGFDEKQFERRPDGEQPPAMAVFFYWTRKLQARLIAEDYRSALTAAEEAQALLWTSPSFFEQAEYHFYAALARAACCDTAPAAERAQYLELLAAHHRQLEEWAANCPENFANRSALVAAEIARLDGRDAEAMRLYEQAISSARANGFVQNEALANELAARFYAKRGVDKIGRLYIRDARYGYLQWGAEGKVRQLDAMYPHLTEEAPDPAPRSATGVQVEHLDLSTVVRVSQAVSGEIVLEKLVDTLMRTAIEHAGAERGRLILAHEDGPRIAAEATTNGDSVIVHLRDEAVSSAVLPESVFHHVLRTREIVILDDAAVRSAFSTDRYIRQHQSRSILCLPLLNEAKLIGVLYLENNLAPRVFVPARIAVLTLLAAQAATALENTRLYRDLAQREAKIRRLVEANIIGIFLWDSEDRFLEANDAFLRILGYDREDLIAGCLRRTDLTPPEWRERDGRAFAEVRAAGRVHPYEKEYFRKDGSRVPVLVGGAAFDERKDLGVAFVLDLTERKRAEDERRNHEVQMALARANRVAAMGRLTASIAHEVNQPIAATLSNAQAALRWLDAQPPAHEEVQQALRRIARDAARAGDIIGRIRAMVEKTAPQKAELEINTAIREVLALLHGEVVRAGVSVRTELAAQELPPVQGDRVQFQQVMLNLIVNALEAMRDVGVGARALVIRTEAAEAGGVVVTVRDTGPGLDPAKLEHLFEAFYTTKHDGLGMGLSICRSIIEAHGGRIWASANEPSGAVFQFTLPRVMAETAAAPRAGEIPIAGAGTSTAL